MISNAALSRFRSMRVPMPAISIAELFAQQVLPDGAFLICGQDSTRVSWARIITSDISEVEAHDMVLIDLSALGTDAVRTLSRIIADLTTLRVRSVGVRGEVSVASLENAARNNISIIYLPSDANLESVERAICRYISEKQNELESQDANWQQELARHANSSNAFQIILKLLADRLSQPVVLHDANRYRIGYALPQNSSEQRWLHQTMLLYDRDLIAHLLPHSTVHPQNANVQESQHSTTAAVISEGALVGYLSVMKPSPQIMDSFSLAALIRAASVCGLLISHNTPSNYYQRSDWITEWLDGTPNDDLLLTARAEQNNFLPDQVYAIGVLRWLPNTEPRPNSRVVRAEQLAEQTRQETTARRINALIGQYHERVIIFLPLEKAQHTGRMRQYMNIISQRLAEVFGGNIMCGVGRPAVGLTDLRVSFEEAERALTLSEQLWHETHIAFFGDLSLNELLMNVSRHEQIYLFCRNWLSSILDYDQQNSSDLLLTLSVYFANNGNMAATAKQLNVHRNTLVYRLNRIAEITQLDMDDADVQLNLHLAIKAYQLLQRLELD